jgi:hypothetical protein
MERGAMLAARILDHSETRKYLVDGVGRFYQGLPTEAVTGGDKQTQAYLMLTREVLAMLS